MEKVNKIGLMVPVMKVNGKIAKNMVLVFIFGLMAPNMKDNG